MQIMIKSILKLAEIPKPDDVASALCSRPLSRKQSKVSKHTRKRFRDNKTHCPIVIPEKADQVPATKHFDSINKTQEYIKRSVNEALIPALAGVTESFRLAF